MEYDNRGNLIKESTYVNGKVFLWYAYEYDKNNNLIRDSHYFEDDPDPSSEELHEYDANGKRIKTRFYYDGKFDYYALYYYNADGTVRQEEYLPDGTLDNYTIYTLDSKGRKSMVYVYTPEGVHDFSVKYEYEDGGNVNRTWYDPEGNIM